MSGDVLAERIVEVAAAGACVKVGNWCCRLIRQPNTTLPLLPPPTVYHAEITTLATPTKWGFSFQGWGDDPTAALTMAMERWRQEASPR